MPAVAGGWRKGRPSRERRYLPVTNEVVRRHLSGEDTVGLYPLLEDDSCWLLAADFDGTGWQLDALAYLDAAGELDLAAHLERSRSGRSCHVCTRGCWRAGRQLVAGRRAMLARAELVGDCCWAFASRAPVSWRSTTGRSGPGRAR